MENTIGQIQFVEKLEGDLMEMFNLLEEYKNTIESRKGMSLLSKTANIENYFKLKKEISYLLLQYSLIADIDKDKFVVVAEEKFGIFIDFDEMNRGDLLSKLTRSIDKVNSFQPG